MYQAASVPTFEALVADQTAERVGNLQPLIGRVAAACVAFDDARPNVHTMVPIRLTKKQRADLVDAYDNRTAAMKRKIQAMVISLPDGNVDLCPYCSLDTNPDLDHFLPKKPFPEFSLHGSNLIPICTPCNRRKSDTYKVGAGGLRAFLDPSIEPTVDNAFLVADVDYNDDKVSVVYKLRLGPLIPLAEQQVIRRHFQRLKLSERFGKRAAAHLAAVKASLKGQAAQAIARVLTTQIAASSVGEPINSWRPVLYTAIAARRGDAIAWIRQ